jgi:site-specific recombinase XerD
LKQYKSNSAKVYKSDISRFIDHFDGNINDLTEKDIETYFSNVNASQKARRRKISVLSKFFKYLEKKESSFKSPIVSGYGKQLKYQGVYNQTEKFEYDLNKWEKSLHVRDSTIQTYKYHISQFFKWYQDAPKSITFDKIKQYQKYLEERYKPTTTWLKMVALHSFLKTILGNKASSVIQIKDLNLIPPKKDKGYYNILSDNEMKTLLKAPDDQSKIGARDKAILYFMCGYGLRANEVCKIKFDDFERTRVNNQQKIWIRDRKGRANARSETAIILNGQSLIALDNWLKKSELNEEKGQPIFYQFIYDFQKADVVPYKKLINKKVPLTVRTIENIVQRYVYQTGLESDFKISPHALRHSAFTLLAKSGVELIDLKYLAGHQDISTTMIYIHSVQSYNDHVGLYNPLNVI